MNVAAIILAAGAGRRMGGPKALLSLGGRSFLAHAVATLSRPGVTRVIAVLGHDAERVRGHAGDLGDVECVRNAAYESGMLSSLLCGLARAEVGGAEAVLVHPVDHPRIGEATVDRVLDALAAGATIAVPSWQGRRGHPAGFARAAWAALRRASPETGARAVLAEHPEWIVHVAGDAGCVSGVNTPEEYEHVSKEWAR
jgi:nicotine blue oxidoreductase